MPCPTTLGSIVAPRIVSDNAVTHIQIADILADLFDYSDPFMSQDVSGRYARKRASNICRSSRKSRLREANHLVFIIFQFGLG